MATPRYPQPGSISSGTLRLEDLIPAGLDTLEELDPEHRLIEEIHGRMEEYEDEEEYYASEDAVWDWEELRDVLNELSPPYCYFGATEGDGADFGFWPDWEIIDHDRHSQDPELPSGPELPEIPASDYFLAINDHGNATLYERVSIWREAWSVV